MASVPSARGQILPLLRSQPKGSFGKRAIRAVRDCALGLTFALPLIALAAWAGHEGFISLNLAYLEHRAGLVATGPGLRRLQYAYPQLPVLLAWFLPGGVLLLAVITCLFSGTVLAVLARRATLMRLPVLLPLAFLPAMWYSASELLPEVVALTFLAVALQGFIQFSADGDIHSGFVAGLALAVAYAADPGALLFTVVMCLFAPVIGAVRHRGEPQQASIAVVAVIAFPCVAAVAVWSFLLWKFTGNWPGSLAYAPDAHVLAFPDGVHGVLGGLWNAVAAALTDLAHSVMYICVAVLVTIRRRAPAYGLGLLLPILVLILALWLGFDYNPVTAYFMFTLLAVTVITHNPTMDDPRLRWVLLVAAAAQLALAFVWPPTSAGFELWRHDLIY
jgi:hypothetical protein